MLPENLNISQENKETETLAQGRIKNFIYLKDDGFFQDKQKQNRVKDFIEVDDLMDHLNEELKEEQRQRRIIKDYIEVEDLKKHVKDRPREEELNQQMEEHPPMKKYGLRSREKRSAVSNCVSQIVRSEVGQEQERQHLNMMQTSSTSVDRTEEINSNGHIIQRKKQESIKI